MIIFLIFFNFAIYSKELILPFKKVPFEIKLLLTQINKFEYTQENRNLLIKKFKLLEHNFQNISKENQIYFSKFVFYRSILKVKSDPSSTDLFLTKKITILKNLKTTNLFLGWLKDSLLKDFTLIIKDIHYQAMIKMPFKTFYSNRLQQIILKKIKYLIPIYDLLLNNNINFKKYILRLTLTYLDKINLKISFFRKIKIQSKYAYKFKEKMVMFHYPKYILKEDLLPSPEEISQKTLTKLNQIPKAINDWKIIESDFNPIPSLKKLQNKNNKKRKNTIKTENAISVKNRLPIPVNDWILDGINESH